MVILQYLPHISLPYLSKKKPPLEINVFTLDNAQSGIGGLGYTSKSPKVISSKRSDYSIVIEKYVAPNADYPNTGPRREIAKFDNEEVSNSATESLLQKKT